MLQQRFATPAKNLEPAKLKLTYYEANAVFLYIQEKASKVDGPNVHDELIVLAEYYRSGKLLSQAVRHEQRKKASLMVYTIPISIVRLLHRRWQQEPISILMQAALSAFDWVLTQRGLKPDPREPEIFS
ncbi:hypothetical protein GCM10027275_25090 [Rhabdobacter roseus]|uniref:Uncharacterized protein n=1 Tax=Rhabdobacter roseus TaxID=1655419 RepID=A0A840TXS7_9BACT|nr:hypothetical protein [Rhabdobacter roseus]MBB5284449.1 hypothetical protein [Rhabdobacter roseus]